MLVGVLLVLLALATIAALVGVATSLADGEMAPGSWQEKAAQGASRLAAVTGLAVLGGTAAHLGRSWEDWVLLLAALGPVLLVPAVPVALAVVRAAPLGRASYAGTLVLGSGWLATAWWLDRLRA